MNVKSTLAFIVMLFASAAMHAQCLMVEVPLNERIDASSQVFEGKVLSKNSFWNPEHTNIYTSNIIEVYKVFKGDLSAVQVEVVTPGGTVGTEMEVVTPSLELIEGQAGVFLVSPSSVVNSPNALDARLKFEPNASAQSFIKYDLPEQFATDHFRRYSTIEGEVYGSIKNHTGKDFNVIKSYFPSQHAANKTAVAPSITGFSPTTVTAGTLTTLTINGSGFGTNSGSAKVEFKDADDGGISWRAVGVPQIVSWSATSIQVKVPSKCGTGTVRVTDNAGATGTSTATVTMTYGQITAIDGSTKVENRLKMINKNTKGGYDLKYCTAFNNNAPAKAAFERALQTWRCATFVNLQKGVTVANVCNVKDGNNIVNFDSNCLLGGSLIGICYSFFDACSQSGTWYWTLTEMDILFRAVPGGGTWNYGPAASSGGKYDFETIALHELGHAHLVAHVISPPALMHWERNANVDVRTLSSSSDIACGNDVLTRSIVANPCVTTAHQKLTSGTCTVSLIENEGIRSADVTLYPNPLTNTAVLTVSDVLAANGVDFIVYDLAGKEVRRSVITNPVTQISPNDFSEGIYFYSLKKGEELISSGKFVITGN